MLTMFEPGGSVVGLTINTNGNQVACDWSLGELIQLESLIIRDIFECLVMLYFRMDLVYKIV